MTVPPIWLYTLDGTASPGPTIAEGDTIPATGKVALGGGFPANVAKRLVAAQSSLWTWVPIDYKPGFVVENISKTKPFDIPLIPPSSTGLWPQTSTFAAGSNTSTASGYTVAAIDSQNGSIARGVSLVIQHIQNVTSPGQPIVLCGLSQGAWCCDFLLDEFRFGCLKNRYSDLMSVMAFGSPLRPYGHTISLSGATQPAGQGACDFPRQMTYGVEPGLLRTPPSWAWDLCNVGDAASDSSLDPRVIGAVGAIANFGVQGTFNSLLGVDDQIIQLLLHLGYKEAKDVLAEVKLWLPFAVGAITGGNPTLNNPHAQYGNHAYTSLVGNTTQTGVDLAVAQLESLATAWGNSTWTPNPADTTPPLTNITYHPNKPAAQTQLNVSRAQRNPYGGRVVNLPQ